MLLYVRKLTKCYNSCYDIYEQLIGDQINLYCSNRVDNETF